MVAWSPRRGLQGHALGAAKCNPQLERDGLKLVVAYETRYEKRLNNRLEDKRRALEAVGAEE